MGELPRSAQAISTVEEYRALLAVSEAIVSHRDWRAQFRELAGRLHEVVRFDQRFARRMNRRIVTIPSAVMEALVRYAWPGNVRELQNVIERAVILSPGPSLQVPLGDLSPVTAPSPAPTAEAVTLIDYLDPFWVFAIMGLAALPLILLMKKAVARGGLAMH